MTRTRERSHERSVIAVSPTGALVVRGPVFGASACLLRRAAIDAIDAATAQQREVVVDLRRCTGLDDAALVALICADHHAVVSGRRLVLRGPSRSVHQTIRALAGSLLPLVVEAQAEWRGVDRGPLAVVDGPSPVCPPSCDGSSPAVEGCSDEVHLERRLARLARVCSPLHRPARPPEVETA